MTTNSSIYIIDDDRDDQDMLTEVIQEIDPTMRCYTANNGDEGLTKLFGRLIPQPLLIFLDRNMPKVDGKQALTKIKNDPRTAEIPVIIYSTSSYTGDIEEIRKLGAEGYFVKVTDLRTLRTKVKMLITRFSVARPERAFISY